MADKESGTQSIIIKVETVVEGNTVVNENHGKISNCANVQLKQLLNNRSHTTDCYNNSTEQPFVPLPQYLCDENVSQDTDQCVIVSDEETSDKRDTPTVLVYVIEPKRQETSNKSSEYDHSQLTVPVVTDEDSSSPSCFSKHASCVDTGTSNWKDTKSQENQPQTRNSKNSKEEYFDYFDSRARRRHQNRLAATRSRMKKKMRDEFQQRETMNLQKENALLKERLLTQEKEKEMLVNLLTSHMKTCPEFEQLCKLRKISSNLLSNKNLII